MGARSVPLRLRAAEIQAASLPTLSGSASLRDGRLAVSLTNPSLEAGVNVRLRLASGQVAESRGEMLTHSGMRARNTFSNPAEVKTVPLKVNHRGPLVESVIPRQSVVALELRLA
jgi:alpha-N-arabinofuranosidase